MESGREELAFQSGVTQTFYVSRQVGGEKTANGSTSRES